VRVFGEGVFVLDAIVGVVVGLFFEDFFLGIEILDWALPGPVDFRILTGKRA
jgi:hypothetical protein